MLINRYENHTFVTDLLPANPVVIDLGGNQGNFSRNIMAAFPGARAFIVEPHPDLAAGIEKRRIGKVLEAAVAGRGGETRFFINPKRCATLLDTIREEGAHEVVVRTVTLADVFTWAQIQIVDLLKVDIEGSELEMFETSSDDLLRCIGQITIEFHDFLDKEQLPGVKNTIHRLGQLGFLYVNLSWHTHGDMLFINRNRTDYSEWKMLRLRAWKYLAGMKRIVNRLRKINHR